MLETLLVRALRYMRWKRAQRHEVEFWRGIRNCGYEGKSFEEWKILNEKNKLAVLERLGLPPSFYHDKVVVEIGCGPRGVIAFLQAKERIGIEPAINEYRKYFGDLMDPAIRFLACGAESIPLPDRYADVIFCWNCLDHTKDPKQVLGEARRVLRLSGLMSFQVSLGVPSHQQSAAHQELHPWTFEEAELLSLLRNTGFTVSYEIDVTDSKDYEKSFIALCR